MGYNSLTHWVYSGYNVLTNHLLDSWDVQVGLGYFPEVLVCCINVFNSFIEVGASECRKSE